MTVTESIKKFSAEIEKDDELKAKLEALAGQDDALEQVITIAKGYGLTLTEEDFAALADEDFEEDEGTELDYDQLDAVAGGISHSLRALVAFH